MHIINDYRFGQIVIDGKKYTTDVKIFPDRVEENWWRDQGHSLVVNDIEDILEEAPELLIIGTGSAGVMLVPENTQQIIKKRGIDLIIERTGEAYKLYNELSKSKKVIAALHLTC